MLLVDRIIEVNEDRTWCRGLKNVTVNEPCFQGHYPGQPIFPGVLIVECMAQVGAAMVLLNPALADKVPLLGALDNVKFRRVVIPGDQLVVDVDLLWTKGMVGKTKAVAKVDGEIAAMAEMTFKLRAKDR